MGGGKVATWHRFYLRVIDNVGFVHGVRELLREEVQGMKVLKEMQELSPSEPWVEMPGYEHLLLHNRDHSVIFGTQNSRRQTVKVICEVAASRRY
jgi:hypothetical protein